MCGRSGAKSLLGRGGGLLGTLAGAVEDAIELALQVGLMNGLTSEAAFGHPGDQPRDFRGLRAGQRGVVGMGTDHACPLVGWLVGVRRSSANACPRRLPRMVRPVTMFMPFSWPQTVPDRPIRRRGGLV